MSVRVKGPVDEPVPVRRLRSDGVFEYRCWKCGRLVLVGKFTGIVEGHCHRCGRQRRFTEPVEESE